MAKYISVDDIRAATTKCNKIWNTITDASGRGLDEIIDCLPSADTDMSAYSDKLWKTAYERGKAEAQRWIPVTERLPDADSWAIWCSKNGVQQIARLKTDAIDHFFPSQGFFGLDDAAAWMPLPEPYKE